MEGRRPFVSGWLALRTEGRPFIFEKGILSHERPDPFPLNLRSSEDAAILEFMQGGDVSGLSDKEKIQIARQRGIEARKVSVYVE